MMSTVFICASEIEHDFLPQQNPNIPYNLTDLLCHPDAENRLQRYLVDDHGNPNLIDTQGYHQSLLQWCVYKGFVTVVDQLLRHPKINIGYIDERGHHALYMAMAHEEENKSSLHQSHFRMAEKILHVLKDSPLRQSIIDQQDHRGITVLHMACVHHHRDDVELLLKNGADLNVQDQQNRTPLHFASYHGYEDILQLLLDYQADASLLSQEGLSAYDYFVLGEAQSAYRRSPALLNRLKQTQDDMLSQKRQDLLNHPSLKEFKDTYTRKCSAVFLAYKCLDSGDVQHSTNVLSISNVINLLGGNIPLPGAGLVATGLSMAVGAMEDQRDERRRCKITQWFSTIVEMERTVQEGALSLTEIYQDEIRHLTPRGAQALAEEAVARFITHMRSLSLTLDLEKSFKDYALDSLLVSRESLLSWIPQSFLSNTLEVREGINRVWTADDIFQRRQRTEEQPVRTGPLLEREPPSPPLRPQRHGFFARLFGCFAPHTQIRER